MSRIRPPFKYYGGKYYLCKWIISNMPDHSIYIEPFGGGASVLLNKPKTKKEIYNDLNADVSNLMRLIRDEKKLLISELKKIPCEEEVFYEWKNKTPKDSFESSVRYFVLLRMSRSGSITSFSKSKRTCGGIPENASAWKSGIENLEKISARLQNVEIKSEDAMQLLKQYDNEDALWYLDPPYVAKTRASKKIYKIEMTDDSHVSLANLCRFAKSKILLSGYESDLYSKLFSDWKSEKKTQFLHSSHSHGKKKQTKNEILWKNF